MPRDGSATREKILLAALDLVLLNGFAATSIDAVIEKTGLTKGAFFYHFKSKSDLAMALVRKFAEDDKKVLDDTRARADKLSRDPLQQILIFISLFVEMFEPLDEPYPGCLFASYCYESGLFDDEVKQVCANAILSWRDYLGGKIREIMQSQTPQFEVDADNLADMFTTVIEGAFVMSKTLNEPKIVAQHLQHFRNYLELLFSNKS